MGPARARGGRGRTSNFHPSSRVYVPDQRRGPPYRWPIRSACVLTMKIPLEDSCLRPAVFARLESVSNSRRRPPPRCSQQDGRTRSGNARSSIRRSRVGRDAERDRYGPARPGTDQIDVRRAPRCAPERRIRSSRRSRDAGKCEVARRLEIGTRTCTDGDSCRARFKLKWRAPARVPEVSVPSPHPTAFFASARCDGYAFGSCP